MHNELSYLRDRSQWAAAKNVREAELFKFYDVEVSHSHLHLTIGFRTLVDASHRSSPLRQTKKENKKGGKKIIMLSRFSKEVGSRVPLTASAAELRVAVGLLQNIFFQSEIL
jgi:hypothetical protein